MSVIENIDVVMGAQTGELDTGVNKAIKDIDRLKMAANGGGVDVKGFKDLSKSTKSTAEFAGILGSLAGDSAFGQLGQLVGNISEKVSQFSEVSQAGAAGSLAFKAGLVGLVAAGSFNVGKVIGEWWFETKRWNDELANVRTRFQEIGQATREIQANQFSGQMKDLELIASPADKVQAQVNMYQTLGKEMDGLRAKHEAMIKQRDGMTRGWTQSAWDFGEQRNNATIQANEVAEQMRLIESQRRELWSLLDPRNAEIEKIKEAKKLEQEQAAIRKAARDELGKLAQRYDELTLGKDAARRKEMLGLGLTENDVGREENLRKMVEDQEKIAAKMKEDQAEANRIKKDSLTLEEQAIARVKELQSLKEQGLITQLEFDRQLEKAAKEKIKDEPAYKGAVSGQAGSVEAYKLMLERDKGSIEEARKQTRLAETMVELLGQANNNIKAIQPLAAAR